MSKRIRPGRPARVLRDGRIRTVIYIRATAEERELILAQTNPDSRREILLAAIREKGE
jgi:hypothetical protein